METGDQCEAREAFFEKVLRGYQENYDIEMINNGYLTAVAAFHASECGYVLVRKAEIWDADTNEFAFFFIVPVLTEAIARECIEIARKNGLDRIDLSKSKSHMCTRIVALFICDNIEPAAAQIVKKCRIYKSFCFSLKGWMEMHTVAVDMKSNLYSNRYGKETAEFIKSIMSVESILLLD